MPRGKAIAGHSMFRRREVDALVRSAQDTGGLRRVLKPFDLVMLGIGGIIGTGIFVLSGVAAGLHAGNALPLSFIIAGVVCLFAALCYAEFSTMIPVAGSAYTYCYTALGEIWAWIIGWDLILEYGLAVSAVAIGWSGYCAALLRSAGILLPAPFTHPLGVEGGIVNLPAVLIVFALTLLLVQGTKRSAGTNTVIVSIKLAVILLFIVLCIGSVDPGNWVPFMPPAGWFGVFSGAAIVFFAFIGFDAVVTAAEEIENPQKNLPIGLIGSLVVCIVLYVVIGVILTGVVPFAQLAGPDAISAPIAFALNSIGVTWGAAVLSVGAICGMTSVMLVMLFGQSRIFFAMARDGLLPTFFSELHPVTHTPSKVILFIGVVTGCIAGFFPLETVAELVNMGTLVAFAIVAFGVLLLRARQPELLRPFRCPYVPLLPLVCIGACAFLILHLGYLAHVMFLVWLCIGLAVYFLYGIRNSVNRRTSGCGTDEPVRLSPAAAVPAGGPGRAVRSGTGTDPGK
ncbi:MAG TPA: amino acid permease [Methanoregula sp.]|nr:amino acid permease [Methanoregula sp.]